MNETDESLTLDCEPCRSAHLQRLMLASLLEASTLALLVCVAVPLKHFAGFPIGRWLEPPRNSTPGGAGIHSAGGLLQRDIPEEESCASYLPASNCLICAAA